MLVDEPLPLDTGVAVPPSADGIPSLTEHGSVPAEEPLDADEIVVATDVDEVWQQQGCDYHQLQLHLRQPMRERLRSSQPLFTEQLVCGELLTCLHVDLEVSREKHLLPAAVDTAKVIDDTKECPNALTLGTAVGTARQLGVPVQRVMRTTMLLAWSYFCVSFIMFCFY